MDLELEGGATHWHLAHVSVGATGWLLRREFPIAPTFKPSASVLSYSDLDSGCRAAVKEHIRHMNGGEDSMSSVNWALDSIWKLKDYDEYFNFVIVLLCCPVARAFRKGKVAVPDPKPRVLYHLWSTLDSGRSYTLEGYMPVSAMFDPGSYLPLAATARTPSSLACDYDTIDPGAREAIHQIIDRANNESADLTRKPWGLAAISRLNTPSFRKNMPMAEREADRKKIGIAVVLEWQPGPVESDRNRSLPSLPVPATGQASSSNQAHPP
ncbi:hypothetical protein M408DRAFT_330200, partial [Serendipita vermifera MAFF 305830]